MKEFEEPRVLATFDRSWGSKKEELRFERGEFNGKPVYTLRLYWQADDGTWRWCQQKPSQSGKCWERFGLKSKELRALGESAREDRGRARRAAQRFRLRCTLAAPEREGHAGATGGTGEV